MENAPVVFFCAEYALGEDSSMYAGGLGVLAGDFVLEAADEGLPFVAIGLKYKGSMATECIKDFSVIERAGKPVLTDAPYGEETVRARVWARRFGKSAYLLLLDTDISENSPENKAITNRLYDSNPNIQTKQEILLGIGGVRILSKLGITPSAYHLNEGHTAFAAFELLMQKITANKTKDIKTAVASIKEKIAATKHTIFSLSGLSVSEEKFGALVGPYCQANGISANDIFKLGENKNIAKIFSTTQFLLNCAQRQNGVSILHTVFEKLAHPDSILFPITNGVFVKRWQADAWRINLKDKTQLTDETIWQIKRDLREGLVNFVAAKTGVTLDADACTIVWSRRFARYKRPELLFSDLARLERICFGHSKAQFIISGQAHESDTAGLKTIEKIKTIIKNPVFNNKIVYLEDYSTTVAKELVLGADVWLNTPERGFEACGTSGMKAGLNGAIQVSTSDGWIDEVNWSNIGFILPGDDTATAIYDTVEKEIIPLFYKRGTEGLPSEWVKRMRATQKIVASSFTAGRMLHDYLKKSYLVL